jgi:leucyl-tRNA synthetase
MKKYEPKVIEPKWQKIWQETNLYTADLESDKLKYIAMSMFNYPSGAGLHVGHAMNFTISDVKARFKRQQGYESYHPVGWDSFGLPAENYAIKVGVSPQESMATIIPNYHKQYQAMGWSNDWEKEIATHTPEYYKWTQWIFSKMYEQKLAYQDARMQWWCNKCQTVLANEQVTSDNKCWRHEGKDDPVIEKKEVKQWFFKITDYADELLEATDDLDWTESVKLAQKNWIGRSEGAEIRFSVQNYSDEITVFTTRADTLFGVTFMVLAPEHELATKIASPEQEDQVSDYIKLSAKKTEVERQAAKEKTGVFTGAYAINPINNEAVPIYVADYVLGGYGTGAIMAVPAHDERDREFAIKFNLPIKQVVAPYFPPDPGEEWVDGYEIAERNNVAIAVKHWSEDKYLCLKWNVPGKNWKSLVMGGIEDGETPEQAAIRELAEETGYIDVTVEKVDPINYISKYCAEHKKKNRKTNTSQVFIKLNSGKQHGEKLDDQHHDAIWLDKNEMLDFINLSNHKYTAETALGLDHKVKFSEVIVNSSEYNDLSVEEAKLKIVSDLEKKGLAKLKVNYKMRDWSVSRQRYWGAPIPIINCNQCGPVLVPDSDLPVVLPELTDFAPSGDGRSALARAKDWLKVSCPECGGEGERETDTLDTYICSSWYMFRYLDPHNQEKIFDSEIANKWMPIDFYNGGDHATAHLLYARFVTRFFHKLGLVDKPEPFKQMLFNGKVTAHDGAAFSKTLGNGPDPLEIINSGYGADALRTYIMFAAPLELGARWDAQGVPGAYRFLNRLWNLTQEYLEAGDTKLNDDEAKKLLIVANKTTKKVSEDLEKSLYNTAIASCMAALNDLTKLKTEITFGKNDAWTEAIETILMCVAPFAPHITDELWQQLGHSDSINKDHWPELDENYLQEDEITIALMVNGKLRAELKLNKDADKAEMEKAALANPRIQEFLNEREPKKVIVVPGKLVNFVV